jgi:hypothetical protein
MTMDIVEFAQQIIELNDYNTKLWIENERLRGIEEDYRELLQATVKSQDVHSSQVLDLCLNNGKFTNTSVDLYHSHNGAKTK